MRRPRSSAKLFAPDPQNACHAAALRQHGILL